MCDMTQIILVFLAVDGETSWSVLLSLISFSRVQPENTFLYLEGDRSGLRITKKG